MSKSEPTQGELASILGIKRDLAGIKLKTMAEVTLITILNI